MADCDELRRRRAEADARHREAAYAADQARRRGDLQAASDHHRTAVGYYNRMREIEREMAREGCR